MVKKWAKQGVLWWLFVQIFFIYPQDESSWRQAFNTYCLVPYHYTAGKIGEYISPLTGKAVQAALDYVLDYAKNHINHMLIPTKRVYVIGAICGIIIIGYQLQNNYETQKVRKFFTVVRRQKPAPISLLC
ncbi:MAG: hypothetical protein WA432_00855 [Candidatus Babeliaceae bacterium]